ncbi:lipase [Rubrivivax sp. RP6-9]|uniref:lipase n=1 Tax=Rubrivivax sp. RP6-9 TaxID=3415750 RepID=UPI003CC6BCDE
MRLMKAWQLSLLTAVWLTACGGGDPNVPGSGSPRGAPTSKGEFTSVVSFGDSLSDVGTYTPATVIPETSPPVYLGGKFTTNFPTSTGTSTVWVENVAGALGLMITPAEVGFAGQSVKCPIAAQVPALAHTCTGYAQGGSRITDPVGYNHAGGLLTVPVKTQIANHLAGFGSFKASDLILISAGFNEVFVVFEGQYVPAVLAAQAKLRAGTITEDQFKALVFDAQTQAQSAMKTAALELADLIRNEILAKGGKYVAVTDLLDMSLTPEAAALPEALRPMLKTLPETFELWLREGLAGQAVQVLHAHAFFHNVIKDPSAYGFVNVTTPACDAARMPASARGSALFCNATPLAPYNALADGADVNTWFFADLNHPTTGGHKAFSDAVLAQLRSFGWI